MIKNSAGYCVGCGRKLGSRVKEGKESPVSYTKCIRCGLKYCSDCWQPDFIEVCPRCCCGS